MHDEPDTRRVALVLDIVTTLHVTELDRTARRWLCDIVENLADRDITAAPVRVDIDGWPHLFH